MRTLDTGYRNFSDQLAMMPNPYLMKKFRDAQIRTSTGSAAGKKNVW